MTRSEKSSILFLLVLAAAILCASLKLGLGKLREPGPGFFPFLGGAVLFLASAVRLLLDLLDPGVKEEQAERLFAGTRWRKVLVVIIALAVYAWVLETAGFILCTFFLMLLLLRAVEPKSWRITLIQSAAITLVSYVVFEKGLAVGFPKGILGF
jgi:putative tricarboxylic transport membrane protein